MNPEVKAKWVEALRNGNYEQGRSALKSGNTVPQFCCLGVLCDLAEQEGIVESSGGGMYTRFTATADLYDSSMTTLPRAVADWAGIELESGLVGRVMTMNDHEGKSFDEIADHIDYVGDTYESE